MHESGSGRNGSTLERISNAMAALHRESYGRGAAKTRTSWNGDSVFVVLEDIFTPAERTLVDAGNFDVVNQTRSAFQITMRQRFIGIVEEQTGRRVRAFLSQTHANPDISLEFFMLEPTDGTAPESNE